ncbi:hypothetical protein ACL7TT_09075 [Microbulbifer sp. 2304DJ12-6]|uniref:hypothetical protein n=1 Tax=Microbulbifer sp. 2304DJ12-6 TaxID=3233340 RepID=UPI0039AF6C44
MKINIVITILLILSPAAFAKDALPTKYQIHDFEENLKSYLLTKYENFQITELFSKHDDKKQFLKSSLGDDFIKGVVNTKSRELLFKEMSIKTESHVGIAILIYSDEKLAKSALNTIENTSYFENTKILTKYVSHNRGRKNVILYTESSADKLVLEYMSQYFEK